MTDMGPRLDPFRQAHFAPSFHRLQPDLSDGNLDVREPIDSPTLPSFFYLLFYIDGDTAT